MSDAGLKPTVVYHNLTPPELYEKVLRLCLSPLTLPIGTVWRRWGQLQCAHVTEHRCTGSDVFSADGEVLVSLHPVVDCEPKAEVSHYLSEYMMPKRQHRRSARRLTKSKGCLGMQAMQHEPGTNIVANGALATLSGEPYVCTALWQPSVS